MRCPATLLLAVLFMGSAWAQEDKKTDDLKPADPDTGESTVEETTLGLLPQPFGRRESSSRQLISAKRLAILRAV
jgi:porin